MKRHAVLKMLLCVLSSVQSLSCVWLFATLWAAARQASLSISKSWSLLKLIPIETVMPSNHLILCCPLLSWLLSFPASGSFPVNQIFTSGGQSIGVSASTSVLPMNFQDLFPLGWTGWISMLSKGLSRVFSNTTPSSKASILWCTAFFMVELSQLYMITNHCTGTKLKTEKGEVCLGSGGLSVVSER